MSQDTLIENVKSWLTIDNDIKKPLSKEMLFGDLKDGGIVQVDVKDESIVLEVIRDKDVVETT